MSKRAVAKKGSAATSRRLLRKREGYDLRDVHPYVESQNSEEEVIEQPKRTSRKRKAEPAEISEDLPKKRAKLEEKRKRERGEDSRERETLIKRGLEADRKKGEKERLKGYFRKNTFQGSYADRMNRSKQVEEEEPRRGRSLRRKKARRVTIPKRLVKAARKKRQLKPIEELASTNSSMEELSEQELKTPLQRVFADYNKEWWQESQIDIYYDDPDVIEIRAYYPGVPREDLAIELEPLADKKMLTLTAVKIRDKEKIDQGDEVPYYFVERSYGSFVRSIPVPLNVEASQISATYNLKEGYLHVLIPRTRDVSRKTMTKHKVEIKEREHEQQPSITRTVSEVLRSAGSNAQSTGFMAATKAGAGEAGTGSASSLGSDAAPVTGVYNASKASEVTEPENVKKAKELRDAPLATAGFAEES
jgi:HSP20 family molecular chaperone IbpA